MCVTCANICVLRDSRLYREEEGVARRRWANSSWYVRMQFRGAGVWASKRVVRGDDIYQDPVSMQLLTKRTEE